LPRPTYGRRPALTARIADHLNLRNWVYLGGSLCAASERWAGALTLWAAADAAKGGVPNPAEDAYRPCRSEYTGQIERALSPAQVADARKRGARMPAQAAMEFFGVLTEPGSGEVQAAPVDGKLSAREQELVSLVARGGTNAQIATELHISVHTVRSHLDRIRDKTGCRRRTDLTRLALRHVLV
jgi:DNA-binding CsgD family transcriptional regulator